jgi:hypothetical protein
VALWQDTNVSEDLAASIFTVNMEAARYPTTHDLSLHRRANVNSHDKVLETESLRYMMPEDVAMCRKCHLRNLVLGVTHFSFFVSRYSYMSLAAKETFRPYIKVRIVGHLPKVCRHWHNVHTKFHDNWSYGSKFITVGGWTHGHICRNVVAHLDPVISE